MTIRYAVLGDSIQWGQGLREADKSSTLVANALEARHRTDVVRVSRWAHSGASIGTKSSNLVTNQDRWDVGRFEPEDPTEAGNPTLWRQLNTLVGEGKQDKSIDLVLVSGGINDSYTPPDDPDARGSNFGRLLDPFSNTDHLREGARAACGHQLRPFLLEAGTRLPNAMIVVTGYYPVFSLLSLPSYATLFISQVLPLYMTLGLYAMPRGGGVVGAVLTAVVRKLAKILPVVLIEPLAERSRIWAQESTRAILDSVRGVNQQLNANIDSKHKRRHVVIAPADFNATQCLFVPATSRLWGIGLSPDLPPGMDRFSVRETIEWLGEAAYELTTGLFGPLDPLERERKALRGLDDPLAVTLFCRYASVGHPDRGGARAYADAILNALDDGGFNPG